MRDMFYIGPQIGDKLIFYPIFLLRFPFFSLIDLIGCYAEFLFCLISEFAATIFHVKGIFYIALLFFLATSFALPSLLSFKYNY
jgi:hypothetical protein